MDGSLVGASETSTPSQLDFIIKGLVRLILSAAVHLTEVIREAA